jgi:hypothetical protein
VVIIEWFNEKTIVSRHWPADDNIRHGTKMGVRNENLSNLLSENTGAKRRLCAVGEPTFAIAENSEITKVIQQFVVIQQVGGIFRMADSLLIDQVGFKNDVTLRLERSSDLSKQRALQIVEIHDQVVGGNGKFDSL